MERDERVALAESFVFPQQIIDADAKNVKDAELTEAEVYCSQNYRNILKGSADHTKSLADKFLDGEVPDGQVNIPVALSLYELAAKMQSTEAMIAHVKFLFQESRVEEALRFSLTYANVMEDLSKVGGVYKTNVTQLVKESLIVISYMLRANIGLPRLQ